MSSQPDRTFAQLYLAAAELETLRDLVARRLVEVGQPIKEPELTDDVGLLWSLHTCMAEARYQVDPDPDSELVPSVPSSTLTVGDLRRWHERHKYDCVAFSEGQRCCVDEFLAR